MAKTTRKKSPSKQLPKTAVKKVRVIKQPKYKSFKVSKRIKHPAPNLPSSFVLFKQSLGILKKNWKLFLGITVIYGVLHILLVRGLTSGLDINVYKENIKNVLDSNYSSLSTGLAIFGYLLGSSGSNVTDSGNVYQFFLLIIVSLVYIWALRKIYVGEKVTIRDAYYKGSYALVPFILILLIMGVQVIPAWIGTAIYGTVSSNGLAVMGFEKLLWAIFLFLSVLLSIYMLASSVFALYIVTLPDMTPLRALRAARQLVLYRRFMVIRKILFLPLALLVIGAVIIIPVFVLLASLTEPVFLVLGILAVAVVHSYMYNLYRTLL